MSDQSDLLNLDSPTLQRVAEEHGHTAAVNVAKLAAVAAAVADGVRETKAIVDRLAGKAGQRSVKDALADALRSGLLEKTGRGLYNLGPNYRRP